MARNPNVLFRRCENYLRQGVQGLHHRYSTVVRDPLSNRSGAWHCLLLLAVSCRIAAVYGSRVVSQPRQGQESLLQFSHLLVLRFSGKDWPRFDQTAHGASSASIANIG